MKRYYKDHAANLIEMISIGVNEFVLSIAKALESVDSKSSKVRREYLSIERRMRTRATLDGLKDPLGLPDDSSNRVKAVVPMLFVANIMNFGDDYRLRPQLKNKDNGAWSPSYLVVVLRFFKGIKYHGGTLLEDIIGQCGNMLKENPRTNSVTDSIEVLAKMVEGAHDTLNKCKKSTPASLSAKWQEIENQLAPSSSVVSELDSSIKEALGNFHSRLLPQKSAGGPDWDALEKVRAKYVDGMLKPSGKGDAPQSTIKDEPPFAGLYSEHTLTSELHLFCTAALEQGKTVETFHAAKSVSS